ncbi:hypothetical protein B0T22DRAFT_537071 [Podospora appendiculata]|uniref:Uncharacterized protein n=1 Tax=Podospora appendiculata TaxID=314037 RepID=A0AAE0XD16_9PEZI|nr:hypothetical protein B0T22DRAFT_537071 [Podospora appendiculata]
MKGIFSRLKSPQALFSSSGPKDQKTPTIDKVPTILHSCITNSSGNTGGGNYTLAHVVFSPNQTSSPSYHTTTTKTVTLLRGSLTLYTAPDGWRDPAALVATELRPRRDQDHPGGDAAQVPRWPARRVRGPPGVVGDGGAWLTAAVGRLVPHVLLMAVYAEMTDTWAVGEEKKVLEAVGKSKRKEMEGLKRMLVEKYAGDEAIGRAVGSGARVV